MTNPIPRTDPEFKALIPPLSPEEYSQLEQNILARRQCRDAIVTWDNTIVDGHNRFNICITHSIPFQIKEINLASRDEAKLWILDNQLGRRNLSDAARIELALSKAHLLRAKAKENQSRAGGDKSKAGALLSLCPKQDGESVNTRKAVADEAGVSEGTIHNYMQLSKHPELLEAVTNGELEIKTAYRLTDAELLKQIKRTDKLFSFIEKHIPLQDNDAANQEIKAQLTHLLELLDTIRRSKHE